MRPNYQELLELNPLLTNKTTEEVEELIDMIERCGYSWDPTKAMFFNPKIFRGIRTQGLDIFTPENFKKNHEKIIDEQTTNSEQYKHKAQLIILWQRLVKVMFFLFVADLLIGWIFLPLKYWFFSFFLLSILFIFIYLITIVRIKPITPKAQ